MPTVELHFGALPLHVRTARLVAAALGRRVGLDAVVIDEVKLAVGEACSRAVSSAPRGRARPSRSSCGSATTTTSSRSRSTRTCGPLPRVRRRPTATPGAVAEAAASLLDARQLGPGAAYLERTLDVAAWRRGSGSP